MIATTLKAQHTSLMKRVRPQLTSVRFAIGGFLVAGRGRAYVLLLLLRQCHLKSG